MKKKKKTRRKEQIKYFLLFVILMGAIYTSYTYPRFEDTLKVNEEIKLEEKRPLEIRNPYDEVSSSMNDIGTTEERLEILSKGNQKIKTILENYQDYPESLLDMLSRNDEMTKFVLEYPKKEKKAYSNTVGDVKQGIMPLLLQWDKRWGYAPYGNTIIATSGCGPTALSMVVVGLTGNSEITPYKVAKLAEKEGYYVEGVGTSWSLMTEGARKLGIQSKSISLSKENIYHALEKGHPIICSVRRGDFTTAGHFIVLSKIEDGKIRVNDPSSIKRSNLLWEYERLESQIKNLWEFYK